MKNNTIRFGAVIVAIIITTAVVAGYTLAHDRWGGDYSEKKAEVKEAITNNDFEAFTTAVGEDSKFGQQITEENFSKFVEAKQLIEDGNKEDAKAIFEELGIDGYRMGHYGGFHKSVIKSDMHEAIQAAIDNNDYDAWVLATGDFKKHGDNIDEDNFSRYVEAINLKKAGDYEGAKLIFGELGITKSGKFHHWNK